MNKPFSFNPEQYDFWPIYEAIKKYYLLGIPRTEETEALHLYYAGKDALSPLIYDNIQTPKHYRQRWGNFMKSIEKEVTQPVEWYGIYQPCFSGHIELEKTQIGDVLHTKELHFAVSLLGPFYTIFGLDRTTLTLQREIAPFENSTRPITHDHFDTIHAVTCSPFKEYEQPFLLIQSKIAKQFTEYRLVPYHINAMKLEGLKLGPDIDDSPSESTVYQALFTLENTLKFTEAVRGNTHYGYEQWLNSNQPHVALTFFGSDAEFSLLRRKWKLVKAEKQIKGNLTMSIDSAFDFTTLVKSDKNWEGPSKIEFLKERKQGMPQKDIFYLEIIRVSQDQVQLGMHHVGGTPIKADTLLARLDCLPD